MSPEPGLYVHVPFCSAICPYCDFAVTVGNDSRRSRFVARLLAEVERRGPPPSRFDTLYFGGGTPTSLAGEALAALVDELRRLQWLAPECRLFLEANPEDVSHEALRSFRDAGVGTLSLGIQSLDDTSLRFLGRRHGSREARRAVSRAREAGFETLSLDLIYGLPHQSAEEWRRDLESALELDPDHLSCYQLTIHERTLFGRRREEGRLGEATGETQGELFRLTHRLLEDRGFEGYEVSNFARSAEHRSRHNAKYWAHVPYLGIGPSAHSFEGRRRSWNVRSFFEWERRLAEGGLAVAGEETLSDEALLLETLMLRLRTREGLDLDFVKDRFGVDLLELNRSLIRKALADGLLVLERRSIRPTLDGLSVADGLASSFRLFSAPCLEAPK